MIDKNIFNYDKFIKKYKLEYSDKLLEELFEAFKDPLNAYGFCFQRQTKIRELEEVILQDPWACYLYAVHVLFKRWKKAEKIIKTQATASYWYAKDVIKGPWPAGEKAVFSDLVIARLYCIQVLGVIPKNRD